MKSLLALFALCAALTPAGGAASSLVVSAAWSRPAISTGVAYLTIVNHSARADRLLSAASPVARAVELHEPTETKGSMGSMNSMKGMNRGGVASMHPVAYIPVPADSTVKVAPGGYHVMLIGLRRDLHSNETFPLRLHFARAGWITTTVHVMSM